MQDGGKYPFLSGHACIFMYVSVAEPSLPRDSSQSKQQDSKEDSHLVRRTGNLGDRLHGTESHRHPSELDAGE